MFEFECLTQDDIENEVVVEECSPYFGECYPIAES